MNKFFYMLVLSIFFMTSANLFAKNSPKKISNPKNEVKINDILSHKNKDNKKLKLTVNRVVEYLLKNNYDVQKILIDYKSSNSSLKQFQSKYDFFLFGNLGHSYTENPNKDGATFSGVSTTTSNYAVGLKKIFRSGTTVTASINGLYQNQPGAGIPGMTSVVMGGVGYQTGISVEVAQDLLKNFFGVIDRLNEKQIKNVVFMNKQLVKMQLASLLVQAVIGYWNVAIADKMVSTNRENLQSTANIRRLIIKKLRLGLSEREDVNDWSGKYLQGKSNLQIAQKNLFDSKLAVLRTLNLDSKTVIEIGKSFVTSAPNVTLEQALKDAFLKRIDWANQKVALKNAEIDYKIAFYNQFPSLKLKLKAGTADYDKTSYWNTFNNLNEDYSVSLELSYPLGNTAGEVKIRDARLKIKKIYVETKQLEQVIRDEIISNVKQCDVNYSIYLQTKRALAFSRNYYYQVLTKFKRGRYSAVQLKMAFDSYMLAQQQELQSLVNYNTSLLKRDLSRNVIFENFNIDINGILKKFDD